MTIIAYSIFGKADSPNFALAERLGELMKIQFNLTDDNIRYSAD